MKPLMPVSVGVACVALAAGVVFTDGLSADAANGAKAKPATAAQLKKTNTLAQKALKKSNANAKAIKSLETLLTELRTGQVAGAPVAGPQGEQGAKGEKGDTGAQGPKGETGPAGPAGQDGAAAEKGDPGEKGEKGDTGEQGPAGQDGAPGAKGDTGEQGPAGPAGADGAQGPKGDTGAQGPAGQDGAPGAKGDKGDPGEQGPAGPAGADGADGAQGPKGDTGAQGPAGQDGAPGAKGDKGDKGDTGASAGAQLHAVTVNRLSSNGTATVSTKISSLASITAQRSDVGGGGTTERYYVNFNNTDLRGCVFTATAVTGSGISIRLSEAPSLANVDGSGGNNDTRVALRPSSALSSGDQINLTAVCPL